MGVGIKKMCSCSCNEKKEEEKNEMNTAKEIEKNKIDKKLNENEKKNKIDLDNTSNTGTKIILPNDNDLINLKNQINNENEINNIKNDNINSNRNNKKFDQSSNNFSDEINSNMIINKDDNLSNLNENKIINISNNSNYLSNNKNNNNYSNRKNNNSNSNSKQKQKPKINQKTLKLFQSNSLSISNPYSPNYKDNLINNITNLNNIFLNKNNNTNDKWRNLDINEIISHNKHNSYKDDDIMYKGNIYKLILTYIFRNCNTKNEKFCLLTQKKLFIFNSKENYLLMNKPNHNIDLNNIENCGRIDFSNLNIKSLNKFYFMYIDIKDNEGENEDEKEDLIYRIIKREQKNKFFVLFSDKENIINEWVCTINYFIQNNIYNE